jgi:hypothetical protein
VCGVVVGEAWREGEVVGSNPRNREARNFRAKNVATCDGDGLALAGAALPELK